MLLLSYAGVNAILVPLTIRLGPHVSVDWQTFSALPGALANGTIYEDIGPVAFVWSPPAAWVMAVVSVVGYYPWLAAHFAALVLLRNSLLFPLMLISYPFWFDAAQGNTLTFSFVAGALALGGSYRGGVAYLVFALLVPRPILLPLAVWLLWSDRRLRAPFAATLVVVAAATLASGYTIEWFQAIAAYEPEWPGVAAVPQSAFGRWWLLAGIPLGIWLASRGWLGWAGLAMSPYLTPQYLMWPLLDLARRRARSRSIAVRTDSGG